MLPSLALGVLLSTGSALATVTCSANSKCPKITPCCSTYGECGVGAYCLGGCDPTMSYSLDACMPAPVCKDRTLTMNSLDRVSDVGDYLGNSTEADWMSSGEPVLYNGNTLLTMAKDTSGTVLSSTVYMWYGNVKARLKTSRGAGVVTAFILFSDVKDEIDFEFIGVDLETAQTNYYFQGITTYPTHAENLTMSNSYKNFHDYEIRWTPDKVEWYIDDTLGRTLNKEDTWNETTQNFDFPQTPARVQLSLWPGGLSTNEAGTIAWAGGEIDWESDDIENYGYDFATFSEVVMECYNATSAPGTNSGTSYTYDSTRATNDTVVDGDDETILSSFQATGLNPSKGAKSASESATVPGGSTSNHDDSSDSSSESSSASSASSTSTASSSVDAANCKTTSFNQGCDSDSSSGIKTSASIQLLLIISCALYWL
ncbi:concanavalin A-like lectin/glucanase domain-containing protein [Dactylonectria estremocensis]|uniref:Crh-like protein n=1 Tax=Dactylonectria estremocensis TaxID=1079267 RepID=A0A9P9DML4_9HYPO|nr:concanavalin A-like lectin/glucanase domain-containing protein [Dactylonectria estremocensis]